MMSSDSSSLPLLLFGITSIALSHLPTLKKKRRRGNEMSRALREVLEDSSFPVSRRDGKDRACIESIIRREGARLLKVGRGWNEEEDERFDIYRQLRVFAQGVWEGAKGITELMMEENSSHNEGLGDSDHWFELNMTNGNIFRKSMVMGSDELLPGRLFATRISLNPVMKNDGAQKEFRQKLTTESIRMVVMLCKLTEYEYYQTFESKYLFDSVEVEFILIPMPVFDSDSSESDPMPSSISVIIYALARGENVILIHSSERDGTISVFIAAVFHELGVNSPISRAVGMKGSHVITDVQEEYVMTLPLCSSRRLSDDFPHLVQVVAAGHVLNVLDSTCWSPHHRDIDVSHDSLLVGSLVHMINAAFDMLDVDSAESVSVAEVMRIFVETKAETEAELFLETLRLTSEDNYNEDVLSRDNFLRLMRHLELNIR